MLAQRLDDPRAIEAEPKIGLPPQGCSGAGDSIANIDKTRFRVKPGKKIRLSDYNPADTSLMPDKDKVKVQIQKDLEKMTELQDRFYPEHQRALLVVLQGMDTSGKDGTIKHVMSGVNPLGCSVSSFKAPAGEELDHDFLWRFESLTIAHLSISIFRVCLS